MQCYRLKLDLFSTDRMEEESEQEFHLELTKKDKTFVRELIKIHLGVNLATEEDYEENSTLDANSYEITKEDDSESQIQVMKKTLIEEVFCQYLKNNIFDPVEQLPVEESDINSDVKGIKCNESIPGKTVVFNKNDSVFETMKKKLSETSKEFSFSPNKDYFVSNKVENLSVIEKFDSPEKIKPDPSNFFDSKNSTAKFITLTDESEDVLMIEENNDSKC